MQAGQMPVFVVPPIAVRFALPIIPTFDAKIARRARCRGAWYSDKLIAGFCVA